MRGPASLKRRRADLASRRAPVQSESNGQNKPFVRRVNAASMGPLAPRSSALVSPATTVALARQSLHEHVWPRYCTTLVV